MEADTKQVDDGVAATAKAGESLQEILTTSQKVGDMILQIAFTATEQTTTAEGINANAGQIASMAHGSAASAQQEAKACEQLSDLAVDLQQLVSRFKLGNHPDEQDGAKAKLERLFTDNKDDRFVSGHAHSAFRLAEDTRMKSPELYG
jgi:hypothetical protein